MKYFYADSTGYVSNVMFDTLSDCLGDIRMSLGLASFSDSSFFNVYGIQSISNRIVSSSISLLYVVNRKGVVL